MTDFGFKGILLQDFLSPKLQYNFMNGTWETKDPLHTQTQETSELLFPKSMDIFLICIVLFTGDRIQVTELWNRWVDKVVWFAMHSPVWVQEDGDTHHWDTILLPPVCQAPVVQIVYPHKWRQKSLIKRVEKLHSNMSILTSWINCLTFILHFIELIVFPYFTGVIA